MKTRLALALLALAGISVAALILVHPTGSRAGVHRHDKGAEIDVTVIDDEGDPVRYATIIAERADGTVVSRGTTNAAGGATVHIAQADGRYVIRAVLPKKYRPVKDTDGMTVGACGLRHDPRLCTTLQSTRGTITMPGAPLGHRDPSSVRFDVFDPAPTPQIDVVVIDLNSNKPVTAGTIAVRSTKRGAAPLGVANGTTGIIPTGSYRVTWTPPGNWSAVGRTSKTVLVLDKTEVKFYGRKRTRAAIVPAPEGGATPATSGTSTAPAPTPAPPRRAGRNTRTPTPTRVNVVVLDVASGKVVNGGRIRWSVVEGDTLVQRNGRAGSKRIDAPGPLIVKLIAPPQGYRLIGTDTIKVVAGANTTGSFSVKALAETTPPPVTTPAEPAPDSGESTTPRPEAPASGGDEEVPSDDSPEDASDNSSDEPIVVEAPASPGVADIVVSLDGEPG